MGPDYYGRLQSTREKLADRAKLFLLALCCVCAAMTLGLILAVVLTKGAFSQPAPAAEQALGNKLLAEIRDGLKCSSDAIRLQEELAKLRAGLAEAKKPVEPTK